jgi:hypothetical protein
MAFFSGVLGILFDGASLEEGGDSRSGEVIKLGVEKNLEGVSIGGHVVSLIDQYGENTPVQ